MFNGKASSLIRSLCSIFSGPSRERKNSPAIQSENTLFAPKIGLKPKCYTSVTAGYQESYPLDLLFDGKEDKFFGAENGKLSPCFNSECPIYRSKFDAIDKAVRRNSGPKSVYILRLACTAEEVLELAARGQFSKTIIDAVNAKDWYFAASLKDPTKIKVEVVANWNFDFALLQKELSNDMEKVNQESKIAINRNNN